MIHKMAGSFTGENSWIMNTFDDVSTNPDDGACQNIFFYFISWAISPNKWKIIELKFSMMEIA